MGITRRCPLVYSARVPLNSAHSLLLSLHLGLQVGYSDGSDRLFLRLPVEVEHVIDEASPLYR